MKNKLPLIVIISMVVMLVLVVAAIVLLQGSSYNAKSSEIAEKTAETQRKVDEITNAKDTNNFTPTELVVAFLNEVKSDATAKAKLYLDSSVQGMDIKNTLKLGSDLANMTVGDSEQTVESDSSTVSINLVVGTDQVARTFELVKVEGVWKIKGITAI